MDKTIEAFKILTDEERLHLQKKRASKARKRQRAAGQDDAETTADNQALTMEDQHKRHEPVRLPAKVGAVDASSSATGTCQVGITQELSKYTVRYV